MMKRFFCMMLSFLMLLSILAGCEGQSQSNGTSADNSGLPTLRVASLSSIHSLPNYYIEQNGLDIEAGFKIETTYFSAGSAENEALAANLWDVGSMGTVPAATAVANYDAKIVFEICSMEEGTKILCRPDSPIAKAANYNPEYPDMLGDPSSVKGITILGPIGTCGHQLMLAWIQALGLSEEDVQLVHMDYASAYQAFVAGEGDVLLTCPPVLYKAIEDGYTEIVNAKGMGLSDTIPYVVNAASLDDPGKKEALVKFLKLILDVNEKFTNDPELEGEWLNKFWTEKAVEVDAKYISEEIGMSPLTTADSLADVQIGESVKNAAEFQVELGQMDESKLSLFQTNCTNEILDLILTD